MRKYTVGLAVLAALLVGGFVWRVADAASQGANGPGTAVDDSSVGTPPWLNPTNALVSDDVYSSVTVAGVDQITDNSIRLTKAGSFVGTSQGNQFDPSHWPAVEAFITYGGMSNLWGTTWTAAEINDSSFGVGISVFKGATPSHYLKVTNFGFSIPVGSVINGIVVESENKSTSATVASVDYVRITVYYTAPPDPYPTSQVTQTSGAATLMSGTMIIP